MTASPQLDALDFEGEPFDALLWSTPTEPANEPVADPTSQPVPEPPAPAPAVAPVAGAPAVGAPVPAGDPVSQLIQDIKAELVAAHISAMSVQTGLQRSALAALGQRGPAIAQPSRPVRTSAPAIPPAPATHPPATPARVYRAYAVTVGYSAETGLSVSAELVRPGASRAAVPEPAATINAFKALARTPVTSVDEAGLAGLARGEIATVFGPAYDQEGGNPAIRLSEGVHGTLVRVLDIARHAGPWNRGRLRAECRVGSGNDSAAAALLAAIVEVSWQAAQVFAMRVGLQLCLASARFEVGANGQCEVEVHEPVEPGTGELTVDVVQIDLIPLPWLRVNAELRRDGEVVAQVRDLVLEVRVDPGVPIAPEVGGVIPRFFGRRNAFGDHALLNEFHMTHSARGDLGIALGPEFTRYAGRRATRMPNHGLQLCDRVMAVQGTRGDLTGGSARTEYDSPADSWYYAESANASMPNVVYMETSLQSALLLGYFLGATLTAPEEDYCLRNLDGTATVLREVELRDKTIQQTSRLLNTTVMVGAVLQTFSYELSVDGEPFYAGESLFGFFNEPALAKQNGLDNGAYLPPWLDSLPVRPPVRTIDVAARRAAGAGTRGSGGVRCSDGHLALLDTVDVVDGGGTFGKGYLRAARPVRADDWFFKYHFYLDPVMPGSLGIEAVIQAIQEWTIDAGLGADLVNPEFVLPTDLPMSWRYRGQILADDGEMTLEIHIKDVRRQDGRVRVTGDASVWKPGMRIYELTDVAVELRGAGAKPC